jgi:hypothetical protein
MKTDGRLNYSSLAEEAGVSRATVERAKALCVEFYNRSQQTLEVPERVQSYQERLRNLEQQLERTIRAKNETIKALQESVELLAQKVQALTLENEQL